MLIEQAPNLTIQPSKLTQSTTSDVTNKVLGKTVTISGVDGLDNSYPISGVMISVAFTVGTAMTPTIKTTATTPAMLDNLLGLVQKIQFNVDETGANQIYKPQGIGGRPVGKRTIVDRSGVSLIELNPLDGLNNDQPTQIMQALTSIQYPGGTSTNPTIPTGDYRLNYFVPLGQLSFSEPLRSRCIVPLHLLKAAPELKLTFASGTELMGGGTYSANISAINVKVTPIRWVPTAQFESAIQKMGGYLIYDDTETAFNPALGSNQPVKIDLVTPGQITAIGLRDYRGGTSVVTRDVIDDNGALGTGLTIATGLNLETEWQVQVNNIPHKAFTKRDLLDFNDNTRTVTGAVVTVTPSSGTATAALNIGGSMPIVPNTNLRPAVVTKLDCLLDAVSAGTGNELGSTLDADSPFQANKKIQLVGKPASVSTYASTMFVRVFRFLSDVSALQQIAP